MTNGNPRVVLAVSLVGTSLAALIALYWFWNRKDEKKSSKREGLRVSKVTSGKSTGQSTECGSPRNSIEVNSFKSPVEINSAGNGLACRPSNQLPLSDVTPEVSFMGASIQSDLQLASNNTSKSASQFDDSKGHVLSAIETTVTHRAVGQTQSEKLSSFCHDDNTALLHDGKMAENDKSGTECPLAANSKGVPETVMNKVTKTVAQVFTETEKEPVIEFDKTDAGVSRNRNVCLHGDSESKPASSRGGSAPIGHDLKQVSENVEIKQVASVSSCNLALPEHLTESVQTDIETKTWPSNQLAVSPEGSSVQTESSESKASIVRDTEASVHVGSKINASEQLPTLQTVDFDDSDIISTVVNFLSNSSGLQSNTDIQNHVELSPEAVSSNKNSLSSSNYKVANNNKDDLSNTNTVNSEILITEDRLQESVEKETSTSAQSCENVVKTLNVEAEECCEKGDNSGGDNQKTLSFASVSPLLLEKNEALSRTADTMREIESAESTKKTSDFAAKTVARSENVAEIESVEDGIQEEPLDREPSQSLSRDSLEPLDSVTGLSPASGETLDTDAVVDKLPEINSEKTDTMTPPAVNGDNTSEASNDSGKGTSVGETVMLHQPLEMTVCQIDFPSELCGRLIGRSGKNINYIKERTATSITLRSNPYTEAYQLCSIEGYPSDIEEALAMIRERFPKARYPDLQLEFTESAQGSPVLLPDLQMTIPPGVSVDVIVSSVATGGLIFLQQPTHPTFPSLERLNQFMFACYSQDQSTPQLPRPVEAGVICAAPVMGGWYRAMVVETLEEECDIKFVDYGGYCRLPINDLRQIRSDFMTLPFQAVECYMGNLTPLQGEMTFGSECDSVLGELTEGKLLQAQVVGRASDGIPFVHIYQVSGNKVLFVNREMVNRGVAQWIEQL